MTFGINHNANPFISSENQGVANLNLTKAFGTALKNVSLSSSPATALFDTLKNRDSSELLSLSYKLNLKGLSAKNKFILDNGSGIKPTQKMQTPKMQILNSLDLSKITADDFKGPESNLLQLMNSTMWWPKNHDSVNTLMNSLRKAIHQ